MRPEGGIGPSGAKIGSDIPAPFASNPGSARRALRDARDLVLWLGARLGIALGLWAAIFQAARAFHAPMLYTVAAPFVGVPMLMLVSWFLLAVVALAWQWAGAVAARAGHREKHA